MCDEWNIDIRDIPHRVAVLLKKIVAGNKCHLKSALSLRMAHEKYSEANVMLSELIEETKPEQVPTLTDFDKSDKKVSKTKCGFKRKKRHPNKGGKIVCGRCGREGHNRRTCTYATLVNGGYIKGQDYPEGHDRK